MSEIVRIKSTSLQSGVGEDIVLRETSTTRLIFRPEIVDNIHDKKACVRGNFIFQKKKPSGKWQDYKTLDLSKLKDGEWIKLEIKAAELFKLINGLNKYYKIFEKYGIVIGETDFMVTPKNARYIIEQFLKNPENFEKLEELTTDNLTKLNLITSIKSLKSVLKTWNDNKTNKDESFWQNFFKDNSWVLAQIFSCPVILFKEQAYVGGKSIDNKDGNVVDFLFKNKLSGNVLLIEIKTPMTSIIGKAYRENKTYCVSSELSGSAIQILNYKDQLQKNYNDLSKGGSIFQTFNPKCMVVIGKLLNGDLSGEQKRSFELYRNDSKQVEVITYDELFQKVKMLVDLLEV